MIGWTRGLALAGLHLAIVASLGGKLLWDRAHRPRAWVMTAPVDPTLPIRGRYLSLGLEVPLAGLPPDPPKVNGVQVPTHARRFVLVRLVPEGSLLRAAYLGEAFGSGSALGNQEAGTVDMIQGQPYVRLQEPVLFFIPEKVQDPSSRSRDQELWVEVTLPRRGPPRPIRLGIRQNGIMTVWNR